MLRQSSNVKLQLSDTNVPQFAEIPPAVICCKNILTKHPKFQNNKVSDFFYYRPPPPRKNEKK